jgi:hypothetical protein
MLYLNEVQVCPKLSCARAGSETVTVLRVRSTMGSFVGMRSSQEDCLFVISFLDAKYVVFFWP